MGQIEWLKSDPYLDAEPADIEFRLTYEGLLYGNKTNRPKHKHDIRKVFHKQLARLWQTNPFLGRTRLFSAKGPEDLLAQHVPERYRTVARIAQVGFGDWCEIYNVPMVEFLAERHTRKGYRFVPLVRTELALSVRDPCLVLAPGSTRISSQVWRSRRASSDSV